MQMNDSTCDQRISQETAYIIAAVFGCIIVVGICGNLLVLGSLLMETKLKFPGSPFLINMTVVDLLNLLIVCPVNLVNLVQRSRAIPDLACVFIGYFKAIFGKISIDSVAVLAFSRMVLVCNPAMYHKMFQFKFEAAMLVAVWVHGVLGSISVEIYGRPYTFEKRNLICSYAFEDTKSLIYGVLIWAMLIPLLFSGLCYVITFVYVHKVQLRIASEKRMTKNTGSRKLLLTLASSYVCYFVFILQYIVVVAVGVRQLAEVTPLMYVLTTWMSSTNYVTNSIVFGLTNSHFRRGYMGIFSKLCKLIKVDDPETSMTVRKYSVQVINHAIIDDHCEGRF